MLGLMSLSEDGDVTLIMLPNPDNRDQLLVIAQVDGVRLPIIPVNIPDLINVLKGMGHYGKTPQDTARLN